MAMRHRQRMVDRVAPSATLAPRRLPLSYQTGLLHLQRSVGNAGVGALIGRGPVERALGAGEGRPLETDVRGFMEARLGEDLSQVRIHIGPAATESAKSLDADAYTVGEDVVFRADRYAPGTAAGRRMLAHELAHVIQQRAGPVAGSPTGDGLRVSDPGDSFEQQAERVADHVVSSPPATN